MASKKSAVLHECDGETVSEIKITSTFDIDKFDFKNISMEDVDDVKGTGKIERECDFEWQEKTLSVFAFTNGKAGKENKTELPPPLDTQLYFGNIIVIAHADGEVTDLPVEEYQEFYNSAFGGFEDLGEEDSWSDDDEEPNTEDEAFIVNDEEDDDDEEFVVNDEEDEEDEEFESEDDTEESGNYSVHSDESSDDDSIKLEEWNLVDDYCSKIDKELLKSPNKFRYKFYTFWEREPEFLKKWTKDQEKNDKDMKQWSKWLKNHQKS